ncbi:MAG: hypothetical protein WCA46_08625, partial [Actinocatenispora sp.]
ADAVPDPVPQLHHAGLAARTAEAPPDSMVQAPPTHRPGMDPSVVCLAVLTALLALLAGTQQLTSGVSRLDASGVARVRGRMRGPPAAPVGLSVAALSVMRT